jgi:hypothetical protein
LFIVELKLWYVAWDRVCTVYIEPIAVYPDPPIKITYKKGRIRSGVKQLNFGWKYLRHSADVFLRRRPDVPVEFYQPCKASNAIRKPPLRTVVFTWGEGWEVRMDFFRCTACGREIHGNRSPH